MTLGVVGRGRTPFFRLRCIERLIADADAVRSRFRPCGAGVANGDDTATEEPTAMEAAATEVTTANVINAAATTKVALAYRFRAPVFARPGAKSSNAMTALPIDKGGPRPLLRVMGFSERLAAGTQRHEG